MTLRIMEERGRASLPTCHARSAEHLSWYTWARTMIEILTEEQAKAKGYYCLTRPYRPSQRHMWIKVLEDMKRGGIACAIVKGHVQGGGTGDYEGVTIWRED